MTALQSNTCGYGKPRGWILLVLALALSFLEAAIWGVGVTKGHHWRVAPRFRPILGLAGVGLLVLVAADVLTKFNLLPRR
jgi:hypothetical protein